MIRLNPEKVSPNSLADIDALCAALDISSAELSDALLLSENERYRRSEVSKKDGSIRVVFNPHFLIRKIQRRINRRIFSNQSVIKWPDYIFGSIPNDDDIQAAVSDRDYVNCARQHCGAKSVLSVDIKDFFDNIHRSQVYQVFYDFLKYPQDVSEALTDVCCKGEHLVQGALTSSYIATLCLYAIEGKVVDRLLKKNLVYTRLVDDITISSVVFKYDFSYALKLVDSMLEDAGLPVNAGKTKLQYASMKPLLVHGLRVDFKEPRLPPNEPRKIRASVRNLEFLAASPGYRASRSYRRDFNRCMGRVNKLLRVQHSQHSALVGRLKKILPLPSHKDIERAERLISRLEVDYLKPGYKEKYWFYKRLYVAYERISILKRSFPLSSKVFMDRLRLIRPESGYE